MSNNDPKRWSILNDLFDAVIDLNPEDQAAKLRDLARTHPDYIKDLQDIVTAHHQAEGFMAKPVAVLSSMDNSRLSDLKSEHKKPKVFKPGAIIDEFEIIEVVGEGSFAVVYRALQKSLERIIALKVSGASDREAQDMASLEHDHIVRVFSEVSVPEQGLHLICMQFVEGLTLAELIKRLGPMNPSLRQGCDLIRIIDSGVSGTTPFNAVASKDRDTLNASTYIGAALWISARLAAALDFAHAKGVLHLDIKPANILLNQYGRPLLTDFNVAMNTSGVHRKKKQTLKGGTAGYMSPEQEQLFASGGTDPSIKIGNTSDIYSLAIVVAELLLGRKVDLSLNRDGSLDNLSFLKDIPSEVSAVLAKALARKPIDRFQSGKDFANALENCRELLTVQASIQNETSWLKICEKHPATCLVLATLFPQFLGSIVNISYNSTRIAADLTTEQQDVFNSTILPYNLVVYPLCFAIVVKQILFLIGHLKSRKSDLTTSPADMSKIRKKILDSTKYLFAACTIGWLPGALVFPMIIDIQAGPLAKDVYWHFGISFVTSWLIALTYSYFFLEILIVNMLYPKSFTGRCNVTQSAAKELPRVETQIKMFQIMAGAIPLFGALMIVGSSSASMDIDRYRLFQTMVIVLIAMAISGFVIAIKTSEKLNSVISIYLRKTNS